MVTMALGLNGRRYVWPPGTHDNVLPSVTTILDNVAKQEWLVPAAGRVVANYAVDHILQWEHLPESDAKQLLAGVAKRAWDLKADLGTDAHDAITQALDGQDHTLDERTTPYVAGAMAFLNDHARRILHHEAVVYNLKYQYAGRVDCIAELKTGAIAIVDWKSGKVSNAVALQINGYARAKFVGFRDGTQATLPPIDAGYVVQLPGDGTYTAHPVAITDRAFKTFVAYRTIQRWIDEHEHDALGEPIAGGDNAAETP